MNGILFSGNIAILRRNKETKETIWSYIYGEGKINLQHDVGFMWHLSAGVNYRITQNKESRSRNLYAASLLSARFNPEGNFIRAWNWEPCAAIIDYKNCMFTLKKEK